MPNTSKHHQTPLKKIILKLPCQKSPRHFWTPCFGLFGLLTLHKSHNPMFRDHLPACQPSRHLLVFEGRDEHTVGKNLRRLLNVSRMGGTCTGHADVKVDIAVRLAGVRIWMDLGCFPLQFSRFFQLFSPRISMFDRSEDFLRPWRCMAVPFPPSRTRSAPAWPATPGCDWQTCCLDFGS